MRLKSLIFFFTLILSGILYAETFTLYSNDLSGQLTQNQVASSFGCNGKNISPELNWKNIPRETKSFAITVYDPDAPTGSGWWHWIVFNIPADITYLPADFGNVNKIKKSNIIQSTNNTGNKGFLGACPPKGDKAHAYIFTIHALSIENIPLGENDTAAHVGFIINANTIKRQA